MEWDVMCRSQISAKRGIFFFNDTATTEIYTLSLHDALPICLPRPCAYGSELNQVWTNLLDNAIDALGDRGTIRSEEHTSELQSRQYLVCRLLLEKKKNRPMTIRSHDSHALIPFPIRVYENMP